MTPLTPLYRNSLLLLPLLHAAPVTIVSSNNARWSLSAPEFSRSFAAAAACMHSCPCAFVSQSESQSVFNGLRQFSTPLGWKTNALFPNKHNKKKSTKTEHTLQKSQRVHFLPLKSRLHPCVCVCNFTAWKMRAWNWGKFGLRRLKTNNGD